MILGLGWGSRLPVRPLSCREEPVDMTRAPWVLGGTWFSPLDTGPGEVWPHFGSRFSGVMVACGNHWQYGSISETRRIEYQEETQNLRSGGKELP